MKVVSFVALLLAVLIDALPASAAIRARSRTVVRNRQAKVRHVNRQEVKLVVPFAVPVGVPVAPFSPYFYGYQQFRVDPIESHSATPVTALPDRAASLVATQCATCHSGPAPQGEVRLDRPEALDASHRLAAIRAVLAGRMPKGGTLTPDELRAILAELAKE